ncbi:MAG: cell division protein ZapA [Candidatus Polarisedimenticolia bacterium]|nr:cell division protein ZapA [bacterium]
MSDETAAQREIEVVMGTRRYKLRGEDPAVLAALAAKVDRTLGEIAGPSGNPDDFRTAVLAALNIAADEEDGRAAALERLRALLGDLRDAESRLKALDADL